MTDCIETLAPSSPLITTASTDVKHYRRLGRSGLRVSPFCLGTGGKFGNLWCAPWTVNLNEARQFLQCFMEAGGNFIDTANCYHESESMLGTLLTDLPDRDALVIATKFSFGTTNGDPNSGGNGRKHIIKALEDSLRRLKTDYIDMFWMHNWDTLTPVEELMSTLNTLVQSGKVRYIGLSNIPAWYVSRAQTLAELRGMEKLCAIQMEYSLAVRTIEFEYFPAATELGLGICAWGPLANGLLSGKYRSSGDILEGEGRIQHSGVIDPYIDPHHTQIKAIIATLHTIAETLNRTPAQIALNWISQQPQIASTLIGASTLTQLTENIRAFDFALPPDMINQLENVSKPAPFYPYFFHEGDYLASVHAQTQIKK